mgnify:CR=1 FL=1
MRIKTELAERPPEFIVSHEGNRASIVFYTDVVEKQREAAEEGETTTYYEAVSWTMEVPWTDNIEERIRTGLAAWLAKAQQDASEIAAAAVRVARDQLLADSDASMALDRLGLTVPTGSTFTAWLSFFKGLGEVLTGSFAKYRQALRDIPEQEGFPFNVEWPEKP